MESPLPQIHLRDLWGTGKLAQLARESRYETEPAYSPLAPAPALGNPLADRRYSAAYTSWPRLPELFPVSFPGIKTSRDPLLVDIDRERLIDRMGFYLNIQNSDEEVSKALPIAMTDATRFPAKETRRELLERRIAEIMLSIESGNFKDLETSQRNLTKSQTERYCYRPYDIRWLYWESHTKLLDEKREDYWRARTGSYISMISAQSNRRAYDPPYVTRSLASLHVLEKGSSIFPLEVFEESLFDPEKPDKEYDNIPATSPPSTPPIGPLAMFSFTR
jgi:hypothetical protein